MSGRYVALGSSMAAGPGIRPGAPGAPFGSGRSARNYAHLVAEQLDLEPASTSRFPAPPPAHVLAERQRRARPQIEALDGSEELVTITIGGNDVGYVPLLMAATLPRPARLLPAIGALFDRDAREQALDGVGRLVAGGRRRGARACAAGAGGVRRLPHAVAAGWNAGAAVVGGATPNWVGTSPRDWKRPPQRPRRPLAANWCVPGKPVGSITAGRRSRGRWGRAGRCHGVPRHSTPTPPACAPSPGWWQRGSDQRGQPFASHHLYSDLTSDPPMMPSIWF